MKSFWLRRILCKRLFPVLFALSQIGCQTETDYHSTDVNPLEPIYAIPVRVPANSSARERVRLKVFYTQEPKPFTFRVGNEEVGTEPKYLVEFLEKRGATDIVLESEYELTPKRARDLVNIFHEAGIKVVEFWVPQASSPDRVDLMNVR